MQEFDLSSLKWEEVFPQGIDSSKMVPQKWNQLAEIINERRSKYRGIIVIHGTDTLMYTAAGTIGHNKLFYNLTFISTQLFILHCHEIQSRLFLRLQWSTGTIRTVTLFRI